MVQPYLEQALLAASLAVNQGMVAPERAAFLLAEALNSGGKSWLELAAERRVLSGSNVALLRKMMDEQLQARPGESVQALTICAFDSQFKRALDQINHPELKRALLEVQVTNNESQSDANTMTGDRYATLGSEAPVNANWRDDPYITGAHLDTSSADLSPPSAAPDSAESSISGTAQMAVSNVSAVAPGNSPTQPDQKILPSESVLEVEPAAAFNTKPSMPPEFQSLEHETLQPERDYATLQSGLTNTDLPGSGNQSAQDSIPWPLRFRVLREHAKGGLGKVSVAEDLELHREVAFKEIQRNYADDTEARTRFLLEAEITGGLEHPGIVPVYGLGTHADGRPYYAMRFIRGRSLQQAIDQYFRAAKQGPDAGPVQLEFRQLLRRFIDVCNAIDYAHNRGVLHRDLKPANVMLGDYGETLVVDWGLAKSVSVSGSLFRTSLEPLTPKYSGDASQTVMGVAIGTPQFMSPEQARGKLDELGPASDVYSLGATLYTLLTGIAAFTSRDLNTVLKQVKAGTFPPPIQINPSVPKPLNAICLKSMAHIPALRYASARALAEDIEHWLADEPVIAYTENRWERASRWIRRHQARAQAIGVSVIVVAVVSTVAALLIEQSRRKESEALAKLIIANNKEIEAHRQETLAKQEALRRSRQTREAVDELLTGVTDALGDFPGMQDARRRLLERAARDYLRLAEEKSSDPELQMEAVRGFERLGDVYVKLNSMDQARDALQKADALLRNLLMRPNAPISYQFEQAAVSAKRGLLEASAAQYKQADVYFQEAITALKKLTMEKPGEIDYQDGLGTAMIGLGRSQLQAGEHRIAGKNLQEGLFLFQALQKRHPNNIRVLIATAAAQTEFARFLLDSAQPLEAVKLLEDSITIHDDIVAEFPREPDYFARRATARVNLAEALRSLGRWPAVVSNYESAVTDLQIVVRARPDIPRHRENLAVARTNLGQSLRKLGNNTAAVPVLEKGLENFDELSASFPIPRYVDGVGNTRTSLAQVLSELGQQDQALELITTAEADYRELLELDGEVAAYHEGLGIVQSNRGRILARKGDLTAGVKSFEEAVASLKLAREKDPNTPRIADNLAWVWTHFGQVQFAAGQAAPARDAFQAALTLREELVRKHGESPQYRDSLAWLLATCPVEELRNPTRAEDRSQLTTNSAPDSPQFWLTAGAAHLAKGDRAAAIDALGKSLQFRGLDDGITLCLKAISEFKRAPVEAAESLTRAKAYQAAQKPVDEELAYWIKQAEAAVMAKSP